MRTIGPEPDVACHLSVVAGDMSRRGLRAAFALIAPAGYRRVVLPPLDPYLADVEGIRGALQAHGLSAITIAVQGGGADVSSPEPRERIAGRELLLRQIELTTALGSDQMNGVPYGPFGRAERPPSRDQLLWSAEAVGAAADTAAERGITMNFEVLNRYETAMINTAAQAAEFVELSGSSNLWIHLDTFHLAVEEEDLIGAINGSIPRLGYLELGQSGRGGLVSGALDLTSIVESAVRAGYRGRFGVEAFSRPNMSSADADMLGIWRATYDDPAALAAQAIEVVSEGWRAAASARRYTYSKEST